MGIVRIILALSVVLAHIPSNYKLINGDQAVQLFYIISGYLISYILVEDKRYKSNARFWLSRYLRIYPTYLAVALITAAIYVVTNDSFFELYHSIPWSARISLILSNISLFGQDHIMFSAVKDGALIYPTDFHHTDQYLWKGLLVPQAWSLGVELSFYLIAPFIITSKKKIMIAIAISYLFRLYLDKLGIGHQDPWSYRFFPKELIWFLLGSLSHQCLHGAYVTILSENSMKRAALYATGSVVFASFAYNRFVDENTSEFLLISMIIAFLPFLFVFQNNHKYDKFAGELSYPIYICHWLVLYVLQYFSILEDNASILQVALALFIVILSGHVLNLLVDRNVEIIRGKLRTRGHKKTSSNSPYVDAQPAVPNRARSSVFNTFP